MRRSWRILAGFPSKVKTQLHRLFDIGGDAYRQHLIHRTHPHALFVGHITARKRRHDFSIIEVQFSAVSGDILFGILADVFDVEVTECLVGTNRLRASREGFCCKNIRSDMLTCREQLPNTCKGFLRG